MFSYSDISCIIFTIESMVKSEAHLTLSPSWESSRVEGLSLGPTLHRLGGDVTQVE